MKILISPLLFDDVSYEDIIDRVRRAIDHEESLTIFGANFHHVRLATHDKDFQRCLNRADVLHQDGKGIFWAARMLYGRHSFGNYLTGTDLYAEILTEANRQGWFLFLLGETDAILSLAVERIRKNYPNVRVVGTHHGFMRIDDEGPVQQIKPLRPQILLVGMGVPKQEFWISRYREQLPHCVCIAVGAGLMFLSGLIPRAPKWMQKAGLEWLFRLMLEPRRLWQRYVLGIPIFVFEIVKTKLKTK